MVLFFLSPRGILCENTISYIFKALWLLGVQPLLANTNTADTTFFKHDTDRAGIILNCSPDLTLQIPSGFCAMTVSIPQPLAYSTDCQGLVRVSVQSPFGVGYGPFTNISAGVYQVNCSAENDCDYSTSCSFKITVKENQKPTAVLTNGLFANVNSNGLLMVNARQLNQGSYDNCTSANRLRYSFSLSVADSMRTFQCSQQGEHPVNIVVFDESGNKAHGISKIVVMDNLGVCDFGEISGQITDNQGLSLSNVQLNFQNISFNEVCFTDANGRFLLEDLPPQTACSLKPICDENPLNGVSTYDLILLQRHLSGQQILTDPYKIIAADVNKSGSVTAEDLLELRNLILGNQTVFSNNQSWQFVKKSYQFPNPQNPFNPVFPEIWETESLAGGTNFADFIAIKTGDLNGNAQTNNSQNPSTENRKNLEKLFLTLDNQSFSKGQELTVRLKMPENKTDLIGTQFTLMFDMNLLALNHISPAKLNGMAFENIGLSHRQEGAVTVSWNSDLEQNCSGAEIITAKFATLGAGSLDKALSLGNEATPSEATDKHGQMHNLDLKFNTNYEQSGNIELLSNLPNPFTEVTMVRFKLPEAGIAVLKVFDTDGVLVHEKSGDFMEGSNQFLLQRSDLHFAGVYAYQIEAATGTASRKLIMF